MKKTFNEYLNSKGKIEDSKVDISGDRTDPMTPPNAPPKGKPYANVDGKSKKSEKGFGDHGDKELMFKYDTKCANKKGVKLPTVEFAQYELIPLISESLEKNPFIAESMVRELKRRGVLGTLVGELMEHKETYKHIASLMGHKSCGEQVCKKLVRAMTEEISPPFGSNHDDSEEGDFDDTGLEDVSVDDNNMDFSNLEDNGENEGEMGEPCQDCDGQGMDENGEECPSCQGTGIINNDMGMDDMDGGGMNGDMGMDDMDGDGMGMDGMNPMDSPNQSPSMKNFQRAMMSRR